MAPICQNLGWLLVCLGMGCCGRNANTSNIWSWERWFPHFLSKIVRKKEQASIPQSYTISSQEICTRKMGQNCSGHCVPASPAGLLPHCQSHSAQHGIQSFVLFSLAISLNHGLRWRLRKSTAAADYTHSIRSGTDKLTQIEGLWVIYPQDQLLSATVI